MKYHVGDTVLVQGKVTQLDIRDYSLRLEFEDEVSAWFGEHELFELPKPDKTYEQGLEDAWELAKKIAMEKSNGGFDSCEIVDIFGLNDMDAIFMSYTPQEALAKLKAYEESQKIKVGDVVEKNGHRFVIISADGEFATCLNANGSFSYIPKESCKKTGKHIDIESMLGQIKGGCQ